MAGTATHLAVADRVCEKLGCDAFKNLSLFYCGNIAPDAIHARVNYIRAYKKHTHLTEGMSGRDFQDEAKLDEYHGRLRAFAREYLEERDENFDLHRGYYAHLVCDELFNIQIRALFQDAAAEQGIKETDDAFRKMIARETDSVDRMIIAKYPFKNDAKAMLDATWDYEVRGMVTADEINRSKSWVIGKLFNSDFSAEETSCYTYERALRFIDDTASEIIERFNTVKGIPNG